MRTLPHSLICLIHYAELNNAGWWDEAIDRYTLAELWLLKEPAPGQQIRKGILKNLLLDIKAQELNKALARLKAKGDIISFGDGRYKLSNETLQRLEACVESACTLEQTVQEDFCQRVRLACPNLDPIQTWKLLTDQFIVPFVMNEGARTYSYFVINTKSSPWVSHADTFLALIPVSYREQMRQVVHDFFTRDDSAISSFLLSYLDAYFLLSASGLPAKTLKVLTQVAQDKITFAIFVDTNFVYSILGLHDNPSNEAATDLMELVQSASDHLRVQFFIKQSTLDETQGSIKYHRAQLANTPYPPNIAEAALGRGVEISGVYKTFFERVKASGRSINPADYFAPYENNLTQILAEKGVTAFPESTSGRYEETLEVIEDIEAAEKYEKDKYGQDTKSEQQLTHDVVLWHFVRDQRGTNISSPLHAKYWIVTVDYRFLGFDRHKTGTGYRLPVCMHPNQLIQMLRFFVPRSPQFEKTLLGMMRLPIISREFNTKAEQVSIRIMNHLARHEGIEDLQVDTIASVVADDTLRSQLNNINNDEEEATIIQDTLAGQLRAHELLLERQSQEITGLKEHITTLGANLADYSEKAHEQISYKAQAESARLRAEQEVQNYSNALMRSEQERNRYKLLFHVLFGSIIALVGVAGIYVLPSYWQWLLNHPHRLGLQIAATVFILGISWMITDVDRRRQWFAFGSMVVAALIAAVQIV